MATGLLGTEVIPQNPLFNTKNLIKNIRVPGLGFVGAAPAAGLLTALYPSSGAGSEELAWEEQNMRRINSAQDVIDNHLNRDVHSSGAGYIFTPPEQEIVNTELPLITPEYQTYDESFVTPDSRVVDQGFITPDTQFQDEGFITPSSADMTTLYNKGLLGEEVIEDGLLSETAPPFYSKITKTIEDAQMNKASGDGWMGMINNSGVNQDELDWIGMKDFLADKKSVTKEEILDFARMNDLSTEVKEVILGQKADKLIFKGDTMEMIEGQGTTLTHDPRVPEILRNANGFEDAKLVIMNNAPLYNQLENYYPEYVQEKNIQYPVPFDGFSNDEENIVVKNFLKDKFNIEVDQNDSQGRTIHNTLVTEGDYTDYKEMTFALPNIDADFTKGHYKGKNIFAHARFNTRDIDGKKTLFIEELQSDWVHKGKNFGYSDLTLNVDEINNELIRLSRQKEELIDTDYSTMSEHNAAQELIKEIKEKYEQLINKREAFVTSKKVPDLPFKKNWQDIVLKRMIRYAAENGFDAIAMTGGNIQKDRYDLSKHIDTLSYNETTGSINGYKDGESVLFEQGITKDNLADYVGKEVAKKIQEAEYEKITMEGAEKVKMKRLSGLDLQVGGEGLGNMYDTIFKSSLKKVGKKYGAEVEFKILNENAKELFSKEKGNFDYTKTALKNVNSFIDAEDVIRNDEYLKSEFELWLRDNGHLPSEKLKPESKSKFIKHFLEDDYGFNESFYNKKQELNMWHMNLTDSLKKQSIEAGMPIAFNKPVNPLFNYA